MGLTIYQLVITADKRFEEEFNPYTGNTDVIVELSNGEKYVASFFSYKSIEAIAMENKVRNDFLKGKYLWTKNMVLIENCSKELIQEVVQEMIDEGEFLTAFCQL